MRVLWAALTTAALVDASTTCRVVYSSASTTPSPTTTTSGNNSTSAPTTLSPDTTTPLPTTVLLNVTTLPPTNNATEIPVATTNISTTTPVPTTTALATVKPVATTVKPTAKPTPTTAPAERRLQDFTADNRTNSSTIAHKDGSWAGTSVITPAPTTVHSLDVACDEKFYDQWAAKNLTCGGAALDVSRAVAAASCSIYQGTSQSCVSMCTFPSCEDNAWKYDAVKGSLSSIYASVDIASFFPSALNMTTLSVSSTCPVGSALDASFASCGCTAPTPSPATSTNASEPQTTAPAAFRPIDLRNYSSWHWTNAEAAVSPIAKTTAATSIAIGTVVTISGSVVSSATAATTAAASSSMMLLTFDMLQFGTMINQMPLDEKNAVLTEFGAQMKFAVFNYLGFLLPNNTSTTRRLTSADCQGVCVYAATVGVPETVLFVLTLAGIFVAGIVIILLYGIAYAFVTYALKKPHITATWFDYVIGFIVILGMASQYAIGVTAMYQIYLGFRDSVYNFAFFLAIFSLLFLAGGLVAFGYYIIKKHEQELRDVEKVEHMKKSVNMRYGALYDEYTFENRYFFAPKMILALLCGMTTGAAFMNGTLQVVLILIFHICFLVHLEQCQPFQTRFLQNSMSFITLVKIVTLILSMFLITSIEGLPASFHNVISNIIVALQVLVLAALMIRQVVLLYQRWRAEKKYDHDVAEMESALKPLENLETLRRQSTISSRSSGTSLQPIKNGGFVRL